MRMFLSGAPASSPRSRRRSVRSQREFAPGSSALDVLTGLWATAFSAALPPAQHRGRPGEPDRHARARDARPSSVPEAQGDRSSLGLKDDAVRGDRRYGHAAHQDVPDAKELLAAARSVLDNRLGPWVGNHDAPELPLLNAKRACAFVGPAPCCLRRGAGQEDSDAHREERGGREQPGDERITSQQPRPPQSAKPRVRLRPPSDSQTFAQARATEQQSRCQAPVWRSRANRGAKLEGIARRLRARPPRHAVEDATRCRSDRSSPRSSPLP